MAGLSAENPLRDVFNRKVVEGLAARIQAVYPELDKHGFVRETVRPFPELAFLERSRHLREMLHRYLPDDYSRSIQILMQTLGPEIEPGVTVWENFHIISLCSFVSQYGKGHFDVSMKALKEFTRRFSAEGELRTFLEVDYKRCMRYLETWTGDESAHVRRLVSEGTRPRLPMSGRIKRFQKNPRPVIKLLEKLKDDSSLYVRRSVANNMNDIAKDNPELALATLKKWSKHRSPKVQWVVKHASRSLVKAGDPEALALLGKNAKAKVSVRHLRLEPQRDEYRLNDQVEIAFELHSVENKEVSLVVDYVIHYVKSRGDLAPRVFKLRELKLPPRGMTEVRKRHRFRDTSGRTHYAGEHLLEIQVNGKRQGRYRFQLRVPSRRPKT